MGAASKPGPMSAAEQAIRPMYEPDKPAQDGITAKYRDSGASAAFKRAADRDKPPSKLSTEAKRHWRDIMKAVESNHFRPGDLKLLSVFCEQLALYDKLNREARDLDELTSASGNSMHPVIKGAQQTANILGQLASKLGLCPSSQDKANAGKGKKAQQQGWWHNRT
mgnify:CR=1 FL=1